MKAKINYILYVLALIIVIVPIILEQTGNPLTEGMETILLVIGLLLLTVGKVSSAVRRRRAGEGGIFHDVIIIACLIGVAGYLLYQYIM